MHPGSADTLKSRFETVQRYAGWLDREHASVRVRADVEALGNAIEACADPSPLLLSLDTHIAQLPSGALRKILRLAAGQLRGALAGSP